MKRMTPGPTATCGQAVSMEGGVLGRNRRRRRGRANSRRPQARSCATSSTRPPGMGRMATRTMPTRPAPRPAACPRPTWAQPPASAASPRRRARTPSEDTVGGHTEGPRSAAHEQRRRRITPPPTLGGTAAGPTGDARHGRRQRDDDRRQRTRQRRRDTLRHGSGDQRRRDERRAARTTARKPRLSAPASTANTCGRRSSLRTPTASVMQWSSNHTRTSLPE